MGPELVKAHMLWRYIVDSRELNSVSVSFFFKIRGKMLQIQ